MVAFERKPPPPEAYGIHPDYVDRAAIEGCKRSVLRNKLLDDVVITRLGENPGKAFGPTSFRRIQLKSVETLVRTYRRFNEYRAESFNFAPKLFAAARLEILVAQHPINARGNQSRKRRIREARPIVRFVLPGSRKWKM